MRGNEQPLRILRPLLENDPDPKWVKMPVPAVAAHADPLHRENIIGEPDRLALAGRPIGQPKGEVDEGDVEP